MDIAENLQHTDAVGQITTVTGEEVLTTKETSEQSKAQLLKLTSSFLETDQLARSLKLGSVQQVLTGHDSSGPNSATVQTKVVGEDGAALLVTTVGDRSEDALVAGSVLQSIAQQIL